MSLQDKLQNTTALIFCWPYISGNVVCPYEWFVFPVRLPWRKLIYHLQVVIIWKQFRIRDVDMCSLFLLALGPYLVHTHAGPMHTASVSVS